MVLRSLASAVSASFADTQTSAVTTYANKAKAEFESIAVQVEIPSITPQPKTSTQTKAFLLRL